MIILLLKDIPYTRSVKVFLFLCFPPVKHPADFGDNNGNVHGFWSYRNFLGDGARDRFLSN